MQEKSEQVLKSLPVWIQRWTSHESQTWNDEIDEIEAWSDPSKTAKAREVQQIANRRYLKDVRRNKMNRIDANR